SDGAPLGQFEAFDHSWGGGVNVAVGDLDGDGALEVVVGADAAPSGFPLVAVYDLQGRPRSGYVSAFEAGFHGGVRVAVGDFSGTGKANIAVGAGAGGFPLVQLLDGRTFARTARFEVFYHEFAGGVFVSAGPPDAAGHASVVIGGGV